MASSSFLFLLFLPQQILSTCNNIFLTELNASQVLNLHDGLYVNKARDGQHFMVMGDGTNYTQFLGIHPSPAPTPDGGYVTYNLSGQYKQLTGIIGLAGTGHCVNDYGTQTFDGFYFKFYIDNILTHTSTNQVVLADYESVNIDITDGNELKIEVYRNSNWGCDHAVFANPILTCPKYIGYHASTLGTPNWFDAEAHCVSQHCTHLASIHDSTDNTEAHSLCLNMNSNADCWIGMSANGTNWNWADLSDNSYQNWAPSKEPATSGRCGHFSPYAHFQWNNDVCTEIEGNGEPFDFVCNAGSCTTVSPTTTTPTTVTPTSAAPTTNTPTTMIPTTSVPTTVTPTTFAPTTTSPTTMFPTTVSPTTNNPTTTIPTTNNPTTSVPTTTSPTTNNPTTSTPTTNTPTTSNPTAVPTTSIPTTMVPTTYSPTTHVPTTTNPTTSTPTTSDPTTYSPTTLNPTTISPTTSLPTTTSPTTTSPTTTTPTTFEPTATPSLQPSITPTSFTTSPTIYPSSSPTITQYIGYPGSTLGSPDWYAAEAYCVSQHCTHLASIHDANQNSIVHSLCFNMDSNADCWFGFSSDGNNWYWSDSSDNSYRNWEGGHGTPQSGQCSHFSPNQHSLWKHDTCTETQSNNMAFNFVCTAGSCTDTPTTSFPTTITPTTTNPTTQLPTTAQPTITSPTTSQPTTYMPTTTSPTSSQPATVTPTTYNPTTAAPTTSIPTTQMPTTSVPTTVSPTTMSPTTATPTTKTPTTYDPTTTAPTSNPTKEGEVGIGTTSDSQDKLIESKKKSFLEENQSLFMILIILLCVIICLLCLLLYYKKRNRNKKQDFKRTEHEIELERVTSVSDNIPSSPVGTTPLVSSTSNMNTTEQEQNIEINQDPYSDTNALRMWLDNIDLIQYHDVFINEGFGDHMSALHKLNNDDLKDMGINKIAHRKVILEQIKNNVAQIDIVQEGQFTQNETDEPVLPNDNNEENNNSNDENDGDELFTVPGGVSTEKEKDTPMGNDNNNQQKDEKNENNNLLDENDDDEDNNSEDENDVMYKKGKTTTSGYIE